MAGRPKNRSDSVGLTGDRLNEVAELTFWKFACQMFGRPQKFNADLCYEAAIFGRICTLESRRSLR